MTVRAWLVPAGNETGFGVRARELKAAGWTVTVADPEAEFSVAVRFVVPALTAVRKPLFPLVLLTVALAGAATLQCADEVTVCWVPSLSEAVAANCCVWPAARVTEAGLTAMAVTTALVAVTVVFALTLPLDAVITVVPTLAETTSPVLLTVATAGTGSAPGD